MAQRKNVAPIAFTEFLQLYDNSIIRTPYHQWNDVLSSRLTIRQVDQVTVVDVAGRITLVEGVGSMRDKISELLKAGKSEILLDLGKVSYVDSSAICELVAAFTSVKNRGGQLKLLNLTKKVEGLLQITKLYTVFEVFDSEVTAVRSFGASSAVGSS